MAQNSVITQSALNDIKLVLNDIAANLSQHINDSLSLAHGINLLPGAVYTNSNGDIIGNYVVIFYIGNTIYYAPANLTSLVGQPFTNGAIQVNVANPQAVGGAAWVTDFTSQALAAAETTDNDILIPHTQSGHWEVHGGMSVQSKNTYDAQGHLVGRYVIRFQFNNQVYEIPCDTSLSGAPQVLKVSLSTTYLYYPNNLGNFQTQHPSGYPALATAAGGIAPYTFEWHYREDTDPSSTGEIMPATGTNFKDNGYGIGITFTVASSSPFSTMNLTNIQNLSGTNRNLYFYVNVTDADATTVSSDIFRVQCSGF